MHKRKTFLGITIGASSVSYALLGKAEGETGIDNFDSIAHHGNPETIIYKILKENRTDGIAVTGRDYRNYLNLTSISEPRAIENAAEFLNLDADLIISAGGENFILYEMDHDGKISKAVTGNKCASGTGEFFLQQIKRMDLDIDTAIEYGMKGSPFNISGRCSVFCKSDCTHALNKGVPKQNVVAGLSRMTAQKIIELARKTNSKKVVLIGGIAKNKLVVKFLKEHFKKLTVPEEAAYFEALGAALYSLQNKTLPVNLNNLFKQEYSKFTFHEDLKKFSDLVIFKDHEWDIPRNGEVCILGLDVGSTTTKAAIIRKEDAKILAAEYLRTNGDPVEASIKCFKMLF